jgi:hypothetical protein
LALLPFQFQLTLHLRRFFVGSPSYLNSSMGFPSLSLSQLGFPISLHSSVASFPSLVLHFDSCSSLRSFRPGLPLIKFDSSCLWHILQTSPPSPLLQLASDASHATGCALV